MWFTNYVHGSHDQASVQVERSDVCKQVFSRTVAAVNIKRGDMDGSSIIKTLEHFPGGYIADPVVCIN